MLSGVLCDGIAVEGAKFLIEVSASPGISSMGLASSCWDKKRFNGESQRLVRSMKKSIFNS